MPTTFIVRIRLGCWGVWIVGVVLVLGFGLKADADRRTDGRLRKLYVHTNFKFPLPPSSFFYEGTQYVFLEVWPLISSVRRPSL